MQGRGWGFRCDAQGEGDVQDPGVQRMHRVRGPWDDGRGDVESMR